MKYGSNKKIEAFITTTKVNNTIMNKKYMRSKTKENKS